MGPIANKLCLPLHNVQEELIRRLLQLGFLCLSKARQVDCECCLETGPIYAPASKDKHPCNQIEIKVIFFLPL